MKKSSKELRDELLQSLRNLGYEYRPEIVTQEDLLSNLRIQLEKLNSHQIKDFKFTNQEWDNLLQNHIFNPKNEGIENRTELIHTDKHKFELRRNQNPEIIRFLDRTNPENNSLQVIAGSDESNLTILMNGLPMVQIFNDEISPKRPDGLLEFAQIYVFYDNLDTKYCSNITLFKDESIPKRFYFWKDSKGSQIKELIDFSKTFLEPQNIKKIITKYCVFDSYKNLILLQKHQIEATEKILEKVEKSLEQQLQGKNAGGYIWHTEGSNRFLTIFKTSKFLLQNPEIQKVLYLVDRRQINRMVNDYFEKLEIGSIDKTWSSGNLELKINKRQKNKRIIISTNQKFSKLFESEDKLKGVTITDKMVIFMDECHRRQNKCLHDIQDHFPNAHIIGFTTTPIIEPTIRSTKFLYGEELHSYKINEAIADCNVLPINYEYVGDMNNNNGQTYRKSGNQRRKVVEWILEHFNQKTKDGLFNGIFVVALKEEAAVYHMLFEELQENRENKLKVALLYSNSREDFDDYYEDQEDSNGEIKIPSVIHTKEYLEMAKRKYCEMFNLDKDTHTKLYYYQKDISERMESGEINILIVVDKFWNDFYCPRINTLWLDRNLKDQNLIQAISRTNLIFDENKPFGNLVSFRDIDHNLSEAIKKFSKNHEEINKDPGGRGLESQVIMFEILNSKLITGSDF